MADAAVRDPVTKTDERKPAPWWTDADQAELEALVWELTAAVAEHRERCASCQAERRREPISLPCPHVSSAIAVVVDWRDRRSLISRARWLRLERERIEIRRERALLLERKAS